MGRNADKPPLNVLKLIAKFTKPKPPKVIPPSTLANRIRLRKNNGKKGK